MGHVLQFWDEMERHRVKYWVRGAAAGAGRGGAGGAPGPAGGSGRAARPARSCFWAGGFKGFCRHGGLGVQRALHPSLQSITGRREGELRLASWPAAAQCMSPRPAPPRPAPGALRADPGHDGQRLGRGASGGALPGAAVPAGRCLGGAGACCGGGRGRSRARAPTRRAAVGPSCSARGQGRELCALPQRAGPSLALPRPCLLNCTSRGKRSNFLRLTARTYPRRPTCAALRLLPAGGGGAAVPPAGRAEVGGDGAQVPAGRAAHAQRL